MEIDPVLDTLMSIEVFVFIGVMIWLYFREDTEDSGAEAEASPLPEDSQR